MTTTSNLNLVSLIHDRIIQHVLTQKNSVMIMWIALTTLMRACFVSKPHRVTSLDANINVQLPGEAQNVIVAKVANPIPQPIRNALMKTSVRYKLVLDALWSLTSLKL